MRTTKNKKKTCKSASASECGKKRENQQFYNVIRVINDYNYRLYTERKREKNAVTTTKTCCQLFISAFY